MPGRNRQPDPEKFHADADKFDHWWREKTPAGQAFEAQLKEMGVEVTNPDDKR